ncbi:hypothetical protein OIO90_006520 [Microbotryomycetes sp. JL221]|nr:hypothetical protein OIO90_006520 [Microbotryomycetes sp. JL221]
MKAGSGSELLQRVNLLEDALALVNQRLSEVTSRLDNQRHAAAGSTPVSINTVNSGDLMPPPQQTHDFHSPTMIANHSSNPSQHVLTPQMMLAPDDLPPHDLLMSLIDIYFNHVAPCAPFLQRDNINPVMTAEGSYEWPITVYGIVVCALRFSFDRQWTSLPSKATFRERAKNKVIMYSMSTTSVASIQALTLVALDDLGANTTPEAWGALALTTRTAVHMSLHREETNAFVQTSGVSPMQLLGPSMCFQEEESRRRLFWSIFMLDRWSATATGWDFAFDVENVSRKFPCNDTAWLSDTITMTPMFERSNANRAEINLSSFDTSIDAEFAALIQVTDLLGQVHQLHRRKLVDVVMFREGTVSLDAKLERWHDGLPPVLRLTPKTGASPRTILLQGLFWATVIKLQSLVAYPLIPNLTPNEWSANKAHDAAKHIATLAKVATLHSAYLSWTFFVGARMMLLRAYKKSEAIDPAIQDILRGLQQAALYFDLASRYHTIISRAIKRLQAMDGHLGGASALVDLHHTAFSAESAMLPSGTVTPSDQRHGARSQTPVNHSREFQDEQSKQGQTTAVLLGRILDAAQRSDDDQQFQRQHSESTDQQSLNNLNMLWANGASMLGGTQMTWFDNDLLGHTFESWVDLASINTES